MLCGVCCFLGWGISCGGHPKPWLESVWSVRTQIWRMNRSYQMKKERKSILIRENGICKGPVSGASRKKARFSGAQRVTGVWKGGYPTGLCSTLQSYALLLSHRKLLGDSKGRQSWVWYGVDMIRCTFGKIAQPKFPLSTNLLWAGVKKRIWDMACLSRSL